MTRSLRSFVLAAAAAAGVLLLAALPAQAGDEFERAFKSELGRIAANEAVGLGRFVLVGVLRGGYREVNRYERYTEPPQRPRRRERRWSRYDDEERYGYQQPRNDRYGRYDDCGGHSH